MPDPVLAPGNAAGWLLAAVLGAAAGYGINLVADLLPGKLPWRSRWAAPVCLLPPSWRARLGMEAPCQDMALRRHLLVYFFAILLTAALWRAGGASTPKALLLLYGWFFLAVAVIDLEHRRVLNTMLAVAAVVTLLASLLWAPNRLLSTLVGGAAAFLLFLLLHLLMPRGMGMGDVKLAGVIGLMTGFPLVLTALALGVVLGGVAALAVLVAERGRRGLTMAYAPYLVAGALIALVI